VFHAFPPNELPARLLSDAVANIVPKRKGVNMLKTRTEKEKIFVALISAKRNATRISDAPQQPQNDSNCRGNSAVNAWKKRPGLPARFDNAESQA
jgi:hypothetical protein